MFDRPLVALRKCIGDVAFDVHSSNHAIASWSEYRHDNFGKRVT
jgi:hypothetical protein